MSPLQGTLNALIAEASQNTYLTHNKRIDGMMFSATSLGVKIGGGGGVALSGWLLAAGGYVGGAAVQPATAINMLNFMYLWLPVIIAALIAFLLWWLRVEQANNKLPAKVGRKREVGIRAWVWHPQVLPKCAGPSRNATRRPRRPLESPRRHLRREGVAAGRGRNPTSRMRSARCP